jgi:hypothetical protein
LDLTNAYLALEDLLKARYMTPATRQKIHRALKMLNRQAAKEMRELAKRDKDKNAA